MICSCHREFSRCVCLLRVHIVVTSNERVFALCIENVDITERLSCSILNHLSVFVVVGFFGADVHGCGGDVRVLVIVNSSKLKFTVIHTKHQEITHTDEICLVIVHKHLHRAILQPCVVNVVGHVQLHVGCIIKDEKPCACIDHSQKLVCYLKLEISVDSKSVAVCIFYTCDLSPSVAFVVASILVDEVDHCTCPVCRYGIHRTCCIHATKVCKDSAFPILLDYVR